MSETFDITDKKYLQDKVRESYARQLAYRYLLKASHTLKKANFTKHNRIMSLKILAYFTNEYIEFLSNEDYTFSIDNTQRLVTVCMEILFHKIVALTNAEINKTVWLDVLEMTISIVYTVERNFVKNDDLLKSSFGVTKMNAHKYYRERLRNHLDMGEITEEQFKKAQEKTYLKYLDYELLDMMKDIPSDQRHQNMINGIIFIVCFVVLNIMLYVLKYHH